VEDLPRDSSRDQGGPGGGRARGLGAFQSVSVLADFSLRFLWWMQRYPQVQKNFLGTVGITAVGKFGKGSGWGIPTAPIQSLFLTLGGIAEKPGVVDGHIAIREYLYLTVSLDHDIIDGAPAARFIARLKELIESGFGLLDWA
jgi:hypothetical protein